MKKKKGGERERERDRERLRADSRTVVRVIHDAQRRVRAGERVVLAQLHVTLGTAPNNDRTQRKTYFRAPGWGRRIRRGSFGEGLSSQVPHRPAAGSRIGFSRVPGYYGTVLYPGSLCATLGVCTLQVITGLCCVLLYRVVCCLQNIIFI